jgi:hypothetical protein
VYANDPKIENILNLKHYWSQTFLERATQAVFNFLLQILKETINAKSTFWKG